MPALSPIRRLDSDSDVPPGWCRGDGATGVSAGQGSDAGHRARRGSDVTYVAVCAVLPVTAAAGWHLTGSDLRETLLGGLVVSAFGVGPVLTILAVPLWLLGQSFGTATILVAAAVWVGTTALTAAVAAVAGMVKSQPGRVAGLALLCPLALGVATAAVWWFDVRGLDAARDAAYVGAAVLVPLSVVPALRAATPDRTDVVVYRTSEGAIFFGLAAALLPLLAWWAGHRSGAAILGVAAATWFVLGWVGVFRHGHLIPDSYGPDQWAPW
jgi:hypothetical protein